jgi:hypothetical protein
MSIDYAQEHKKSAQTLWYPTLYLKSLEGRGFSLWKPVPQQLGYVGICNLNQWHSFFTTSKALFCVHIYFGNSKK